MKQTLRGLRKVGYLTQRKRPRPAGDLPDVPSPSHPPEQIPRAAGSTRLNYRGLIVRGMHHDCHCNTGRHPAMRSETIQRLETRRLLAAQIIDGELFATGTNVN